MKIFKINWSQIASIKLIGFQLLEKSTEFILIKINVTYDIYCYKKNTKK